MWLELESDLTEFMQHYKDQRAIDRQEIIDSGKDLDELHEEHMRDLSDWEIPRVRFVEAKSKAERFILPPFEDEEPRSNSSSPQHNRIATAKCSELLPINLFNSRRERFRSHCGKENLEISCCNLRLSVNKAHQEVEESIARMFTRGFPDCLNLFDTGISQEGTSGSDPLLVPVITLVGVVNKLNEQVNNLDEQVKQLQDTNAGIEEERRTDRYDFTQKLKAVERSISAFYQDRGSKFPQFRLLPPELRRAIATVNQNTNNMVNRPQTLSGLRLLTCLVRSAHMDLNGFVLASLRVPELFLLVGSFETPWEDFNVDFATPATSSMCMQNMPQPRSNAITRYFQRSRPVSWSNMEFDELRYLKSYKAQALDRQELFHELEEDGELSYVEIFEMVDGEDEILWSVLDKWEIPKVRLVEAKYTPI
ncbi:hypothetical protein B0J14DRAFT_673419 [Halenospora varia]|nr:hypothetical protein B0J14DRAFT_673419 [Halenospora varia]